MQAKKNLRADHIGSHRQVYEKNRKRIFASQQICGICGQLVDFSIKFPDPMSAVIDHIIPINKGGSPDDIDNMQLAHMCCNRAKSDKLFLEDNSKNKGTFKANAKTINNRNLPQSMDWTAYKEK